MHTTSARFLQLFIGGTANLPGVLIIILGILGSWLTAQGQTTAPTVWEFADLPENAPYRVECQRLPNGDYEIRLELAALHTQTVMQSGNSYVRMWVPQAGQTTQWGQAAEPVLERMLALLPGTPASLEMLAHSTVPVALGDALPMPAQLPVERRLGNDPNQIITPAGYAQTAQAAARPWLELGKPGQLGNVPYISLRFRLAQFEFSPTNPTTTAHVLTRGRWIVRLNGGSVPKVQQPSPVFRSQHQAWMLNWADVQAAAATQRTATQAAASGLLVLCPDSMAGTMQPYLLWKWEMGHNVQLALLSQVGNDVEDIDRHIAAEYASWAPDYVLLVGGPDALPLDPGVAGLNLTDHVYACVDTLDYLPDVAIARFSAMDNTALSAMLTKLLEYERNPDLANPDWFGGASVIASWDGIDDDHGMLMKQFFLDNGFQSVDEVRDSMNLPNAQQVVLDGLQAGRSWVFFIGHGGPGGWYNYTFMLENTEVRATQNQSYQPAIISIACANADLDWTDDESFAELWMNVGVNQGAANILAATENTPFFWSDTLGKQAVFDYFSRTAETFGAAAVSGKLAMYNAFPEDPGGTTESTMQQFIVLGDPLQMPWTAFPQSFIVSGPDTIDVNTATASYNVRNAATNQGVPGALVCLSQAGWDWQQAGRTDSLGNVALSLALPDTGRITLTVSAYNFIPKQLPLQAIVDLDTQVVALSASVGAQPQVELWPNPATTHLNLSLGQPASVTVYGAQGQPLRTAAVPAGSLALPLQGLPQGAYWLRVETATGVETRRFLKGS